MTLRTPARLLAALIFAMLLSAACADNPTAHPSGDGAIGEDVDQGDAQGAAPSVGSSAEVAAATEPDIQQASDPGAEADDGAGEGIRFVSISTNYSEKTNTLTLEASRPPGIEPGDLLVAQFVARSNPVSAIDPGWTLVGEQAGQTVWIKEVTEDEPSSYTWMQGDPDRLGRSGVIVAAYRGVDLEDPVVGYALEAGSGTSRELVAPSVETEVDGAMVVRMWSTQSPGGDALGIQPPFEVGSFERARIYVDITNRAVQTLADAVHEEAGPSGEAVATTTWDVSSSWNHTVVLRPDG
jgi:hypothetical protein